ncbi:MAG: lysoplasmalogenase [Chloroflexi bacterium]|nr:lysoplasmalogenase [Chloroflexota bacterium]
MAWLLAFCGLSAGLNWWAVERRQRRWVLVTKPAMMLFLIAWTAWFALERGAAGELAWLLAGLGFSLAGDVLLMGEGLGFFRAGLLAFLLAHIAYIMHFWPLVPAGAWPAALVLVGLLALFSWRFGVRVHRGLLETGRLRLFRAVAAYTLVISVMVLSAALRWLDAQWPPLAAGGALLGALLFFTSDVLNARRRFIAHFAHEELWVMSTYHLGQILLAVSAAIKISQGGVG